MGEKTEKASPKKLKDARKKGQVAKSQDLPSAFTFIASIAVTLGMSHFLYSKLGGFFKSTFNLVSSNQEMTVLIPSLFYESINVIFITSLPVMALVAALGVVVNFLAVGPVFSTEVFKFDIKKFDMVQNLKAKFKMKTLVELLKSLLKISIAGYLIYGVMYKSLPVLTKAVALPMSGALLIFHAFLMEVIIKVGIFFIVVAVLDFAYQKYNFGKEMMMEKFELKQEYKNTEGDPQIKGKRKQIAQEIAYSEGPGGGVKRAAAVVTNPVHLAIAIGYNKEIDPAPYILTMGDGILADRILHFAEKYEIPVVRNIPLAHELWQNGEVYEYVPEESYEALAEILLWIASLEEKDPDAVLASTSKYEKPEEE
jgi:type III secretion protein U